MSRKLRATTHLGVSGKRRGIYQMTSVHSTYPENPEETQVIVGSINMEYISDTSRGVAGRGGPGVRTPPASFKFTCSNDPNPMSFLLGVGVGVMGMGKGHIVTICVDLILRLVFIVVHNCDM